VYLLLPVLMFTKHFVVFLSVFVVKYILINNVFLLKVHTTDIRCCGNESLILQRCLRCSETCSVTILSWLWCTILLFAPRWNRKVKPLRLRQSAMIPKQKNRLDKVSLISKKI
jgi:hypothetical protein